MTRQRFCPICDRSFNDGEAVLKCPACGLLHHPGCWVKNEGCSAGCEGNTPEPLAYSLPGRADTPHPAEGTRVAGVQPASRTEEPRDPLERVTPIARQQPGDDAGDEGDTDDADDGPVIGRARPNAGGWAQGAAAPTPSPPPRAQRGRYPAGQRKAPPVEDMRLYGRRGVLRYWYVPIAAVLAIGIAVGVVWAADEYLGSRGDTPAAAGDNGDEAGPNDEDEALAPAPTPTPEPTPGDEADPVPAEFGPGVAGVVTGTGAGGCLNIRVAPGTENDAIICVPDGTSLTVVSGPEEAGNLVWWEISAVEIVGWAAEDYMAIDESAYVDNGDEQEGE